MAADSSIVIETDKQAIITPKLKDAEGNTMLWDQARSKLQAEASWSDLDNLGVGTLTPNATGAAVFVATDVGVTGVRLLILRSIKTQASAQSTGNGYLSTTSCPNAIR